MNLSDTAKKVITRGVLPGAVAGGGIGYYAGDKGDKLKSTLGGAALGGAYGGLLSTSFHKAYNKGYSNSYYKNYHYKGSRNNFNPSTFGKMNFKDSLSAIGATGSEATKAEVRKKFLQAARKHHPDFGGSTEKMQNLNKAWTDVQESKWFQKLAHLNFWEGFSKQASAFAHGAELAGLGMLAKPSYDALKGKEWSEKNKNRAEVAGLGVLALPSLYEAGKGAVNLGKKYLHR